MVADDCILQCSGRFPANLIYTSLTPPPNVAFSFPLASPSHACFLLGFYNNNRPQPQPAQPPGGVNQPNATTYNSNNKRPTPVTEPSGGGPNKKAKPNPPTTIAPGPAIGRPKPTRTPSNAAAGQLPPMIKPSPSNNNNDNNNNIQQYLSDVKANGGRTSQQSMNGSAGGGGGAFATGSQGTPRSVGGGRSAATPTTATPLGPPPPPSNAGGQQQPQPPYQHSGGQPLPQIPPEMRAKVEAHLESIRTRVQRGQMTQEQAAMQIRQLQELTNQCVFAFFSFFLYSCCYCLLWEGESGGGWNWTAYLISFFRFIHISRLFRQRLRIAQQQAAMAAAAANNNNNGGGGSGASSTTNSTPTTAGPMASPALGGGGGLHTNAGAPQPQRMDSLTGHRPVWKGQISWAWNAGTTGARTEYTMYCQATPMQQSAVTEL